MLQRIIEIKFELQSRERKFRREEEKITDELRHVQAVCTHPEIGEVFMFICPGCGYDGGPTSHEELSERDYENYQKNIEETRKWRRALQVKYSKDEIKSMIRQIKEKLEAVKSEFLSEKMSLEREWEVIVASCTHSNMASSICNDCGWCKAELLF